MTKQLDGAGTLEFRILGPPEIGGGGGPLRLGGGRQRTLLAVLLLHANRVVPVDRLVDAVWDEAPPATVVAQLQAQVSALRTVLSRAGAGRPLATEAPGYVLHVAPGALDLDVFERLLAGAREALAAGRPQEAFDGFSAALALWRGPALGGLDARALRVEADRLEELRLAAVEGRIEAGLALGRHGALVGELRALVAAHPLRERLRGQLMLALHRDGRRADALAAYRDGRRTSVAELGLEPGAELRRLEHAILTADPLLDAPRDVPTSAPPPRPSLLPADIADFTGRHAQVAILERALEAARPSAVPVAAVVGTAGAGKTALAVHVAHRLRDAFPDGQLYAGLRGSATPAAEPRDVLRRFLLALGVDAAAIPDGEEERAELYRMRLADRRVLIVLDDAASAAQVRPLLPGSGACAVLVTSRARPAGLEGARLVELDVLAPEHAVELLSQVAGRRRVEAQPEAAAAIARDCGYLPLAVRAAGARLASRSHWRLSRLAERLGDPHRRLDELRSDALDVRGRLASAYRALDAEQRRAFRRLGLLEAEYFGSWAAAALLEVPPGRAEHALETLVDAHLVEADEHERGWLRYRFRALVRDFARERALAEESDEQRSAALGRALG